MKKSSYTLFLLMCFMLSTFALSENKTNLCASGEACAQSQSYTQFNAVRIIRSVDEKITISYILPVNSAEMRKSGISQDEISTYKFYLSIYVTAWANSFVDKVVDGVNIKKCVYWQEFDGMGFSLIFDDVLAQQKFFGGQGQSTAMAKPKEKGFLFKKTIVSTTFPISSEESAKSFQKICLMAMESWQKEEGVESEKVQKLTDFLQKCDYIYDFSGGQKGLCSQNSYEVEGVVHNVFVKTLEQIKEDPTITFWIKTANKPVWCLLALVTVLIVMTGCFLWINCKHIHKKK